MRRGGVARPNEDVSMNADDNRCNLRAGLIYGVSVLGAFLIVAALVAAMLHYTRPAPLNAERAAERANALRELRAAEAEALQTTAWLDKGKGVVRLRIDDAMALAEKVWQNPDAARSNLMARLEKAYPPPPPAAPPKPSPFE